jgi:hypothetical protein
MPSVKTVDSLLLVPSGGASAPSGGLSVDQALPWLIDVDVFEQAVSHVTWDNVGQDVRTILSFWKATTGPQGSEINFDVVLSSGIWTFELMHVQSPTKGIYTVQLDGVTVGTIDGYSANTNGDWGIRSVVTGISVATTGKKRLKLLMATQNASSSGYSGQIVHIQLRRTA